MNDQSAPSFWLKNATALLPDGFSNVHILVENGLIAAISETAPNPMAPQLDLTDFWLMPGIIDLHGDGFERHVAPRRGAISDLEGGLIQTEAELAANGITTAYLAQFYSWEGGMRGPEFATAFFKALHAFTPIGTDMRPQLRFEDHMLADYPAAAQLITEFHIDYVVMNDHLPHQALAAGKTPPRLTGQALKARRSPENHHALLQQLHANGADVPQAVRALVDQFIGQSVKFGSHDSADAQSWAHSKSLGLSIAEFPETREAALSAHNDGAAVIMGAPNVLRGGSHKRNVAATDLVRENLCSALASDYHYGALPQAAQMLAADIGWQKAWSLISAGPANVMGLRDRGMITENNRADFTILPKNGGRIAATMAQGKFTHLTHPLSHRAMHVG